MTKRRITVTVDEDRIEAANDAVAAGEVSSVSAWVNGAMADKSEHRRRLQALGEAIADYEAEYGEISEEEMAEQRRLDLRAAAAVRARVKARLKAAE